MEKDTIATLKLIGEVVAPPLAGIGTWLVTRSVGLAALATTVVAGTELGLEFYQAERVELAASVREAEEANSRISAALTDLRAVASAQAKAAEALVAKKPVAKQQAG